MLGCSENSIKICDSVTGRLINTLNGHLNPVTCVAISSDNSLIVSGSKDSSIKIWDRRTGQLLATLMGSDNPVHSVAISHRNQKIVSSDCIGRIKISDSISYTNESWSLPIATLDGDYNYVASNVAIFSYDGSKIISGGKNSVKIWDTDIYVLITKLKLTVSSNWITCVAISHRDLKIVSGDNGGIAAIWDAITYKLLSELDFKKWIIC